MVDSWFLKAFSIFDPHVSAQATFASRSEEANGTRRGHMNTSCMCYKYGDMLLLFEKTSSPACEVLEKVVGAQSKPHLQRHVLL